MKCLVRILSAGSLLVPLVIGGSLLNRDEADVESYPCGSPALKVDVQEIHGAHIHESVNVKSYNQCCTACWSKKGCALFTYVAEDALGNDNYCRLTYRWYASIQSSTPNKCTEKITTGYETTTGDNGIYWNFGAGPCGTAEAM